MTASPLEAAGLLVACGGTAVAIAAPGWRWRWVALTVALIAAPVLLAGDVWGDSRFADVRSTPALVGAGVLLVAVGIPAAVWAFRRWDWAFAVSAFAVLALRLPVRIGGETSSLLVPLYLVIAGGLATTLWEEHRPGGSQWTPPPAEATAVVWLRRLLAATLVLYALQALYSEDVSNAIENACFFLVPFGALFALLAEVRWSERLLSLTALAVAAIGVGYALVAFGEYAARDLILNSQLLESNQIKPYFRVNSVFHDPTVLGRYLALVILVLGAGIAWSRGQWWAALATVTGLVLLAALVLTFSITSVIALLVGLVALAGLRYGPRGGAAAAMTTVAAGAVFFALGGAGGEEKGPDRSFNDVTSGRVGLVEGGLELAEDRPLLGWGSGAFGRAYFDQIRETETTTSHSEPLTVAAEQGVAGMALYVALLGSILWVTFSAGVRNSGARSAVAACMLAIIAHSIGYAGFAIDPATWGLLALGVALHPGRAARQPAE
jgi:O-antigen ligase